MRSEIELFGVIGKNSRCTLEYLLDFSNDNFQHPFVGVFPSAFRQLNDKGSLRLEAAFEQAQGLLQIVEVVGADSVLTVRDCVEVSGGHDHRGWVSQFMVVSLSDLLVRGLGVAAGDYLCRP